MEFDRSPEVLAHIDHVLAEESLILEGLKLAVQQGYITEDDKSEWLSDYIDKRNAE